MCGRGRHLWAGPDGRHFVGVAKTSAAGKNLQSYEKIIIIKIMQNVSYFVIASNPVFG